MDKSISKLGFIDPLMAADALLVQKEAEKVRTWPCGGGGGVLAGPDVIYSAAVPESDEQWELQKTLFLESIF